MILRAVKIATNIKIKVYNKHGVTMEEIRGVLLFNKTYFAKTKVGRYIAIGKFIRHITIIFDYNRKQKEATIITAYPSSQWQIDLCKRKLN